MSSILDRFLAHARSDPDRTAIDAGQERLSYGALRARAESLARGLRARGLRGEAAVAALSCARRICPSPCSA